MLFNQSRKNLSETVRSTTRWLYVIFSSIIIVLGVLYLMHSNRTATDGYALILLEQERTQLMIENEKWSTKLANILSVNNLQQNTELNMTKPKNVTFFRSVDEDVALITDQNLN